jgi:predicted DNA-binding transcriptional regulator AlpA
MKPHRLKRQQRQPQKKTKRTYTRPAPAPLPDTEVVDVNQILAATGWSASTWWEGVRRGDFPQPRRYGPRMTRWLTSEIRELLKNGTGEYVPSEIRKNAGAAA